MSSPTTPGKPPEGIDVASPGDQSPGSSLVPADLIRDSDTVLRAGIMMLGAGTSSLRVRELMRRASAALQLDDLQAAIEFAHISLTVQRNGIFHTQIAEIKCLGVDAHRIAMLQHLSSQMPEKITADELDARLDQIEQTPPLYPMWLLTLLIPLACAAITLLNGGAWREVVALLPATALAFWLYRTMAKLYLNHLSNVLIAAAVASSSYVGITAALNALLGNTSPWMAIGFICASIFLIPGFPLITGGLELTRIDLTAGLPRVVYAAMVLLSITIGVWIVAALSGITPEPAPSPDIAPVLLWSVRALASFIAVFGWAIAFNSPATIAVASGCIGVIGNMPRLLMMDAGIANHTATFVACVIVGLVCALVGHWFSMERIIMTVPTMLVMIPGFSALQTMLYFDSVNVVRAMSSGVFTLSVVIAMVAGLGAARMLTDPEWTFTRPDAPSLAVMVRRHAKRVVHR